MLVRESRRGVSELESMLAAVLLGLFRVPFEHGLEYMYACAYPASPGMLPYEMLKPEAAGFSRAARLERARIVIGSRAAAAWRPPVGQMSDALVAAEGLPHRSDEADA